MARADLPRVAIAGLAGDSGKTLFCLGLVKALIARQLRVAPFKKGPDFIDAAWLGAAAGRSARNLDTFLMPDRAILGSLGQAAESADVAVVEGNRGLFDGMDAQGSHSTAQLAKLTSTPVVLVVDTTKTTRTVAALVKGCQVLDPDLHLAGVILNRVGTGRQEAVIREAVTGATGLPVLGAIPRLKDQHLPSRHLGLVTAVEHPQTAAALDAVARAVEQYADVQAIIDEARKAGSLEPAASMTSATRQPGTNARIGVLKDRAFSFYYPENLAALEEAGAVLSFLSPLEDETVPHIDALYAGGGFPEIHAVELSQNKPFRMAMAARIGEGLPVWAECGGLMYLSRTLIQDGTPYPMVGALPITVEQTPRPQGHGYVVARVDRENPFLEDGTRFAGHEFHYSRLRDNGAKVSTVMRLERGTGVGQGRDGIQVGEVLASYTHVHALGVPDWATGLVNAARGGGA